MSFASFKDCIEEGDTVILYLGVTQIYAIKVQPNIKNKKGVPVPYTLQTVYGALCVMDLVGKKFGSKIHLTKGYGFALYPTPELWTQTLPHRTQILYTPDISLVVTELNVHSGSVVCEAGTGSGSLSHAFLRAIGQHGHLYTCDFHQERVEAAKEEFESHGLGSRVTISRRDVCEEGWAVEAVADAVFLDLPKPWEAMSHALSAIKLTGGRICSFSPCVEQVTRTTECMKELGLTNINTVENLQREFQFRLLSLPPVSVQQVPVNELPIFTNFSNKKPRLEEETKSLSEEAPSNGDSGLTVVVESPNLEGKSDEIEDSIVMNSSSSITTEVDEISTESTSGDGKKSEVASLSGKSTTDKITKEKPSEVKFRSGVPLLKMPGHTGFLTFATVPPCLRRQVNK